MNITGIICEYNPFHLGHKKQLDIVKSAFPDSGIVCLMSGNYVQRGDVSVFSKYERARCAVLGGADIVFELPAYFSLKSGSKVRGRVVIKAKSSADNKMLLQFVVIIGRRCKVNADIFKRARTKQRQQLSAVDMLKYRSSDKVKDIVALYPLPEASPSKGAGL